jgi:CheY-like chemotaxis protein
LVRREEEFFMPSHILVAEDNDIEQQVLKAAFEKEGYIVDSVSDGLSALRKLRTGHYDLALVDYRLPEIDGLASAKLLHDAVEEGSRPKIFAITGASDELKERQGKADVFDAIIEKPYDLSALIELVSKEIKRSPATARSEAADGLWQSLGLVRRPSAIIKPLCNGTDTKVFQSLFDLRAELLPDVIILAAPDGYDAIAEVRENADWFRCPVIDATGQFASLADATLTHLNRETLQEIAKVILRFRERMLNLAPEFQHPDTFENRLLAYLYLSGKHLRAEHFAQAKSCVRYTGFFEFEHAVETAEHLRQRGLLERTFFERVHVCGSCSSARLNAREECSSCRSPNLHREALIHHFRCAWQAPESQFRQGRDLVCPKCSQALRHYGSDYDKPGEVYSCGACSHVSADPMVGFVCFDCGSHADGDSAIHRDIFSYKLTEKGVRRVTVHSRSPGERPSLPAMFPAALEGKCNSKEQGLPAAAVVIVEISYPSAKQVEAQIGRTGFETLRGIFLHNLISALPSGFESQTEGDRDFLISSGGQLKDVSAELLAHCQKNLALRLDPAIRTIQLNNGEHESERPLVCH